MGYLTEFLEGFVRGYGQLSGVEVGEYVALLQVFVFAILIAVYSVFTWKFYRYLSKKDLIGLNLAQYNRTTHPAGNKFFAIILYLIEYIIILPFLIFFWFAVLSMIIFVLSDELNASQVVIVSAAVVTAIRILSYYEEALSGELAKLFPFTVLIIFVLTPNFFSFERVISNIVQIGEFLSSIILFLFLIVVVELIFRVIDVTINFFRSEEGDDSEDDG